MLDTFTFPYFTDTLKKTYLPAAQSMMLNFSILKHNTERVSKTYIIIFM